MIDDDLQRTRVLVRFVGNERKLRQSAGLGQQNGAFHSIGGLHRTVVGGVRPLRLVRRWM
jgi:hypothetical protein